ncbi:phosphotransferase family protein [Mycolicibacterium flavescens]|uniref:Phosphotransferase n=1 Tax=Mycolicibacterium flavescens TaxID=1776 RepID=A0A1E3RIR7_MYCFV|nr:phosphotransferase family protein [Mycolicibacterium flavescens]MCV7280189.1 phosphotransferase family protein [Mycolicibacterium flavescens]ODQ89287.1 phosphotransferase [Mycolicibacterium flavescens]
MAYTSARGDVGAAVRDRLHTWLPAHIAPRGATSFTISEFTVPDAGYSGKTVFFTASWTDPSGRRRSEELVLRLQADDHQLFVTPDAARQAEVMERLAGHGLPVPQIVGVEPDEQVFGAPCYVMTRVRGRVPSDVPSWHKRGWTTELSAVQRELLCDNALRALVAVHRIDDAETIQYLRGHSESSGTALQRYLHDLVTWYEWCNSDLHVGADTLARALRVILDAAPDEDAEGIVWGDARVGNMCFADDLSVAALFDWEAATTGPPGIDMGWWLMFERFLCESLGFTRPAGVPDDSEFIRRYRDFGGVLGEEIAYYQLLAAFVLSLINNRLAVLLVRDGLDPSVARRYPETAVDLVKRYLRQV